MGLREVPVVIDINSLSDEVEDGYDVAPESNGSAPSGRGDDGGAAGSRSTSDGPLIAAVQAKDETAAKEIIHLEDDLSRPE